MPNVPDQPSGEMPAPRTKTGEIIREAKGLGKWFSSLSTAQFQAFALVLLTGFVCVLVGYVLYMRDKAIEGDKVRAEKQLESIMRENNAQGELMRRHCSDEIEKGRIRGEVVTKEIQSILLQHMAQERAKDREQETIRDKEHMRQMQIIQNAWAAFAVKFADLERAIKKQPPEEVLLDVIESLGAAIANRVTEP